MVKSIKIDGHIPDLLIPILHKRQAERFCNSPPPSSSPLESLMRRFRLSPTLAGRLLTGFLLTLGSVPLIAQADASDRPLWLRYPAVSPDGQHIAFVYGGQLWRVPASGGEALPLTSAEFIASNPVWSPDSRSIAFSANRHGNADVFIMPAKGGEIRRLTTHSQADTPQAFTPDGKSVLFSSMRLGDSKVAFGGILSGSSIQLYSIPVTGGRERLIIPTPALDTKPSSDGPGAGTAGVVRRLWGCLARG